MDVVDTAVGAAKGFSVIASFGEIVFRSFFGFTMTFDNMQIESSSNYAEHAIIAGKPKLEYTGESLDEANIDVKLSSYFGVDPITSVKQFQEYRKTREINPLIVGSHVIGNFVITKLSEGIKKVDNFGLITTIELKVTFKEYN